MVRVGSLSEAATSSVEYALGFGLGLALGGALGPEATRIAQAVWSADPTRAVEPGAAAAVVAEDVEQEEWGRGEAAAHGVSSPRFDALVREALEAPAVAELLRMLRRETITPGDFAHGLRKGKLETRWDAGLEELQHERLDPAVLATAMQRGIIDDQGILPVGPPGEGGRVPPMPRADLDAITEAKAAGLNRERLAAITRIVGLPPAPGELLELVNRGHITETDYLRGIAEGNTRNEWGSFLFNLRRRLLSPHEYAELHLRGWIGEQAMTEGAALSGLEAADTALLFKMLGRPLAVHQVTTGLARGGHFGGVYAEVPEPYVTALRQSNVRPEWGNLAYANRYTYPSAFVLRTLVQTGELNEAEGHKTLLEIGWPPPLAEKVARAWAGGTKATVDPHVAKAETQLWGTLHRSYVIEETDEADARTALAAVGVAHAAHARVLELWNEERSIVRRTLTPAQVKKAYRETKFTRDEAVARLERQGYNAADAATFLDE